MTCCWLVVSILSISAWVLDISLLTLLLTLFITFRNAVNVAYLDWKYVNKLSSPGTTLSVFPSGIHKKISVSDGVGLTITDCYQHN